MTTDAAGLPAEPPSRRVDPALTPANRSGPSTARTRQAVAAPASAAPDTPPPRNRPGAVAAPPRPAPPLPPPPAAGAAPGPAGAARRPPPPAASATRDQLSPRERQVMDGVARGLTNSEI